MRTAQWVGEGKRGIISRLKGSKSYFVSIVTRKKPESMERLRVHDISFLNALINISSGICY